MNPTILAPDSCGLGQLLSAGYKKADEMMVLRSTKPIPHPRAQRLVSSSSDPREWTLAYLSSFYGDERLADVVLPKVASLMGEKEVTLLQARIGGETAGVSALFRTRGLIGVYCVGTLP